MSNALNPFQSQQSLTHTAETGSAREIQEVQAAMVIAKRFPRDQVTATDRILQACTRQTLAEGALYSYNRGGSEITGPSIRLAETLAQCWGNIQFGIRELEQRIGDSTVEAFAWDLETNTRQTKVFQVPHERHTKAGSKRLSDPRDIYELVANQGARRLRACILGVIPGDVTEAAVQQCEVTLAAKADTSPEAVKRLVETFGKLGVTAEMLTKRLGNRLEAIRPAQVIQLRKIYASLRDGMSSIGDWFEVAPTPQAESMKARERLMEQAKQLPQPAAASDPPPPAWPQPDSESGELVDARGCPWIEAAHSVGKTCTDSGEWRRKRGVDPELIARLEQEAIRAVSTEIPAESAQGDVQADASDEREPGSDDDE
ncbi:hypothetical protein [uncultured Thiocystis sp.]|jgi:hypothetical protein|uniref:hypothetical protein n=1 Tax=uncultured Thiocystis sp. TaxID=1202134 RepID=UPI00260117EE|nr:hypothetical protein [uncultured Thiocystis sp.]